MCQKMGDLRVEPGYETAQAQLIKGLEAKAITGMKEAPFGQEKSHDSATALPFSAPLICPPCGVLTLAALLFRIFS